MSTINWSQVNSLVRSAVPFIGGMLVMRGVVTATQFDSLVNQLGTIVTDVTVLVGMVTPIATALWGVSSHTDAAVVKAAGDIPGTKVVVAPDAPPAVVAVAKDASVPNVVTTDAHP
jgi:hypothetical protein